MTYTPAQLTADTHVFRLTRALGWIPAKANREQAFLHLDTRIPPAFK